MPADTHDLDQRLLDFIDQPGDERAFGSLALQLFAFQYEHDRVYRSLCDHRGATPGRVQHWTDVPAVPASAFKSLRLASFAEGDTVCTFRTSGTSGQVPGQLPLDAPGLAIAARSFAGVGRRLLFPEGRVRRALLLMPPLEQVPHMAMGLAVRHAFGDDCVDERRHFVDQGRLDVPGFVQALRDAERRGEPVAVFGASFGFVHLFDGLGDTRFELPPGSLLFDGGGYKGRSRELTADAFGQMVQQRLGVPPDHWINVLGMTEVQTAWADGQAQDRSLGRVPRRLKRCVPWVRSTVVSAETLQPLPPGQVGLLRHCCLANRSNPMVVQTDDLGVQDDGGFHMLGRAEGSEARGCSIAMDELLAASAGR